MCFTIIQYASDRDKIPVSKAQVSWIPVLSVYVMYYSTELNKLTNSITSLEKRLWKLTKHPKKLTKRIQGGTDQ